MILGPIWIFGELQYLINSGSICVTGPTWPWLNSEKSQPHFSVSNWHKVEIKNICTPIFWRKFVYIWREMAWHIIEKLLEEVAKHSTFVGKVWITAIFLFRFWRRISEIITYFYRYFVQGILGTRKGLPIMSQLYLFGVPITYIGYKRQVL